MGVKPGLPDQDVQLLKALRELQVIRSLLTRAECALRPLSGKVYNDNGDCSVSNPSTLKFDDFCDAYFAVRALADRGKHLDVIERALRGD